MKETRLSTRRARRLRRDPTEAEARLWTALRNRRLGGSKFRRHAPVGPYVVAFISHEAKVAIELDDGPGAADRVTDRVADHSRDFRGAALLQRKGYRLLRVKSVDVETDLETVTALISAAVAAVPPVDTHPP